MIGIGWLLKRGRRDSLPLGRWSVSLCGEDSGDAERWMEMSRKAASERIVLFRDAKVNIWRQTKDDTKKLGNGRHGLLLIKEAASDLKQL